MDGEWCKYGWGCRQILKRWIDGTEVGVQIGAGDNDCRGEEASRLNDAAVKIMKTVKPCISR